MLDRPVSIHHGNRYRQAGERFGEAFGVADPQPQDCRLAVGRKRRLRCIEDQRRRRFGKDVGVYQGLVGVDGDHQRRPPCRLFDGDLVDRQPAGCCACRHLRRGAGNVVGVRARARRSGRDVESEFGGIGDADVGAGEVIQRRPQANRFARPHRLCLDRQQDGVRVTDGLQVEDREPMRRRPVNAGIGEIVRERPVGAGRVAGVTGRSPVDVPARPHTELDARGDYRSRADRGDARDQPHRPMLGRCPWRGGGVPGACRLRNRRVDQQRCEKGHDVPHEPHNDGTSVSLRRHNG